MEEKRMVIVGVGGVLVIMTITLLAVTLTDEGDSGGGGDPDIKLNKTNPLLLISLDGFRHDYIYRSVPTLETLAREGVHARFLMPSYPTLTFPNHYSIVTGLYPDDHGIVANGFYDPDFNETFSMGVKDGKWWGGEPIWNTVTMQNKTSATYFWPGSDCDINGLYPDHYYNYNSNVSFADRVNQVVTWLSLPEEERPDFVSLYFREPDHTAHAEGPDSLAVNDMLKEMDGFINRLLSGLKERKVLDQVNIIVLADHGMARSGSLGAIQLTDYVPNLASLTTSNYSTYGSFTTLRLKNPNEANLESMLKNLTCPAGPSTMRAFLPRDLPKRFHYSKNKRIGDIVLDLDSGYFTKHPDYPDWKDLLGNHGYDNHISTMGAFFIASGPDFKKNVTLQPFKNIEIYNLMCYLLDVEPAPNNGTEGALYAALLNPPFFPDLPVETPPPAAKFPPDAELNDQTLHLANCTGDPANKTLAWLQEINIGESEQKTLEALHLPWGVPLSGNRSDSLLLLHHNDHVTGYSVDLKIPLWTSFAMTGVNLNPLVEEWSSDVRLSSNTTPSCAAYDDFTVEDWNVTMFPLFNPIFSNSSGAPEVPFLVSNAVPLVNSSKTEDTLMTLARNTWSLQNSPLNFVMGVAFDYDADTLADETINATKLAVPSHFFVVVTRCRQMVPSITNCTNADLDSQAFILPQFQTASNDCLTGMKYATFHLSTVQDVEQLTGLTFFPSLEPETRLQLALGIHTYVWR